VIGTGFSFDWSDDPDAFLFLDTSGSLTRAVTVGNTYTVTLNNEANILGGLGTRTALMDAIFDWSAPIDGAEVPEPTALTLFGLGSLGLAFARRRWQSTDNA
jgi:hypothetical protein